MKRVQKNILLAQYKIERGALKLFSFFILGIGDISTDRYLKKNSLAYFICRKQWTSRLL